MYISNTINVHFSGISFVLYSEVIEIIVFICYQRAGLQRHIELVMYLQDHVEIQCPQITVHCTESGMYVYNSPICFHLFVD